MRLLRTFAAIAAAVAMVAAMGTAAHASTTYTPVGGPDLNFVGTDIVFTFVQPNQTFTCLQFDLRGDVIEPGGSRYFGESTSVVDELNSNGCTNPIFGLTTIDQTGAWGVAVTGSPTGSNWPVRLTNVAFYLETAGCSFNVGGRLDGTFDTATQEFIPTDSGLTITDQPSGFICPLLAFGQGQDVNVDGYWTNTPPEGSSPLFITEGASTSFTLDGGPALSLVGDDVGFTAVQAGQTLTCDQFDLAGYLIDPGDSRAYNVDGGVLDDLTSSGCTNPIAGSTTVDPNGDWYITDTGVPSGTKWPTRLTNVSAFVEAAGCSFNLAGTIEGLFNTASQTFVSTSSGLVIADVPAGVLCPVLGVAQGQDIDVGGAWTNVPPAGSSRLALTTP